MEKICGIYKRTYKQKGSKRSTAAVNKTAEGNRGKKRSDESKKKMSVAKEEYGRLIINIETGIYYYGVRNAALSINISGKTLDNQLSGRSKSKTMFRYA